MDPDAFLTLRSKAGIVPFPEHCVARVRGTEPLAFLHATTTQDLLGLQPGEGALTCLLDDKGHVLAEMRVLLLRNGDVLLDGEPAIHEPLTGWLARVAPLSGCEILDETDDWTRTAIRGPHAATAISSTGFPSTGLPTTEHHHAERNGTILVRVEWGIPGFDLLHPRSAPASIPLNAPPIDHTTFEAERIASGRPRFGIDVTPDLIINETPLLDRAVSATKGCYPGQETVARIRTLGRARRTIAGISSGDHVPHPGTPVLADGQQIGWITSAGLTPEGAVALAVIQSEIEPGTTISVEDHKAEVQALP